MARAPGTVEAGSSGILSPGLVSPLVILNILYWTSGNIHIMGRKERDKTKKAAASIPLPVRLWHLLLPALLAILLYSGTLGAPFVWDEGALITNNSLVHDISNFLHLSEARSHPHYNAIASRYVAYLTFAINYELGGTNPGGYHIVNIAIHALNSVIVSLLALMTIRAVKNPLLKRLEGQGALLAGALFASHPLMTEAVTYVFQRHASLVATFYLLTVLLYSAARQRESRPLYIASIIAAILAMKTKENAFTLPVALLLYELAFLGGPMRQRLARLIPHWLTMLIIPLTIAHVNKARAIAAAAGEIKTGPASAHILGRAEYLYTQMPVVAKYLLMLVLPLGQTIDHGYSRYISLMSPLVALSIALHLLLLGWAVHALARIRDKGSALRPLAFGVLWFYLTLAVESTFVPLQMIITEYRLYLPATGLFIGITIAASIWAAQSPDRLRKARMAAICLVAALSVLAFSRNSIWKTELGIWEDAARKNPSSTRPLLHVGLAYEKAGDYMSALSAYKRALELEPEHFMAHYDIGVIYDKFNRYAEAEAALRAAIGINPRYTPAKNNLAAIMMKTGRLREAEEFLRSAISDNRWDSNPYHNLSLLLLNQKRYAEAEEFLVRITELAPPTHDTYTKLGIVYRETGRTGQAREMFNEGMKRFPGAYFLPLNLAALEETEGRFHEAERLYLRAIRLTPKSKTPPYSSLGRLYIRMGRPDEAIKRLDQALKMNPSDEAARTMRRQAEEMRAGQ